MSQPPQGPVNPPGPNPFDPAAGGPPQGNWSSGHPSQPGAWHPQGNPNQPPQGDWQPQGGPGPDATQAYPQGQPPFGVASAPPPGPAAGSGAGKKTGLSTAAKALIAGGVALAVVGGGTAVVVADPLGLRSGGEDWVEQVPASATMIAGLNLDPGAGQQLELMRFALKFPSVRDNFSLTEGSDPREAAFDALVEDKQCNMTFAEDIDPWFGKQVGMFVPASTQGESVLVLAADKEEPARAAVTKLDECGALSAESMAFNDGFLLVGSGPGLAEAALAEADTTSMVDRAEFKEDMAQLDASGIAMMWADGQALQDLNAGSLGTASDAFAAQQARSMAGALRFAGGNPEVVLVSKANQALPQGAPTQMGELPGDTAAALGLGGGKSYVPLIQDALDSQGIDLSSGTGLRMPQDLETILGDDFVVAAERFDPSAVTDPTQVPVGLRIKTDTEALRSLQFRLNTVGLPISHLDENGTNYLSLSPAYADKLKAPTSKLADQPGFKAAVAEPQQAQTAMYVNIATFADILEQQLDPGSEFTAEDIRALEAFGMSSWGEENDYQRGIARLTAK
ncbi:hypothetical protein [Granulicoccus sp. GXG6511]|uniref:hypothetical protein n=1 Tax=Granulicoccus sp. GXG6511 TaxID=3381351 RepID=UPI003D7EC689